MKREGFETTKGPIYDEKGRKTGEEIGTHWVRAANNKDWVVIDSEFVRGQTRVRVTSRMGVQETKV